MLARTSTLAAVLVLAPLAAATPAEAAPFQIVTARHLFLPAEATVLQGSTLELTNLDVERHDVTALDIGPDGRPMFASRSIGVGQRAVVTGVESLQPSVYPFYCTVHAEMVGNLTVL